MAGRSVSLHRKAGRPRTTAGISFAFRITSAVRAGIDDVARRDGTSRAEAIRKLVVAGLHYDKHQRRAGNRNAA